jgi:hypothetical protein
MGNDAPHPACSHLHFKKIKKQQELYMSVRLCGVVSTVKHFFHRLLIAVTRSNTNLYKVIQSEIFGMRMVKDAQYVLKEKCYSCNK